jgi:hypothetical protein
LDGKIRYEIIKIKLRLKRMNVFRFPPSLRSVGLFSSDVALHRFFYLPAPTRYRNKKPARKGLTKENRIPIRSRRDQTLLLCSASPSPSSATVGSPLHLLLQCSPPWRSLPFHGGRAAQRQEPNPRLSRLSVPSHDQARSRPDHPSTELHSHLAMEGPESRPVGAG